MKKIMFLAMSLAALTWTACDDDSYDDWATPRDLTEAEIAAAQHGADGVTFTVAEASAVDYATIADDQTTVRAFIPTLAFEGEPWLTVSAYDVTLDGQAIEADLDGNVSAEALRSLVQSVYGREPEQRTLAVAVSTTATSTDGAYSVKLASTTQLRVALAPLAIETAYYYVGTANGWSDQFAAAIAFDHSDQNVYDDPVFTLTIKASVDDAGARVDEWFKIAPASAYTSGDFWNNLLAADEDGADPSAQVLTMTGGGAFMLPASDGAAYYRITINVVDNTITVAPIYNAPQFWYLVGGCIADGSWGNNDADGIGKTLIPLYAPSDFAGVISYTGYITTENWGFKLVKTPGSWDEQMGSTDDALTPGGGGNFNVPQNGYYTVAYNQVSQTLSIEAADITPATWERITLSGDFNGWGDTDMTPVTSTAEGENHDWWADITIASDGGIKFKGNADWGTNWGQETFPYGTGEQNGPNIPIKAGTYRVLFNDIQGTYIFFDTADDVF